MATSYSRAGQSLEHAPGMAGEYDAIITGKKKKKKKKLSDQVNVPPNRRSTRKEPGPGAKEKLKKQLAQSVLDEATDRIISLRVKADEASKKGHTEAALAFRQAAILAKKRLAVLKKKYGS